MTVTVTYATMLNGEVWKIKHLSKRTSGNIEPSPLGHANDAGTRNASPASSGSGLSPTRPL